MLTYDALEAGQLRSIVEVQLGRLAAHMDEQEIGLEVSDAAKDALAEEGFSPEYGARPLKRAIQKRVQNLLADAILKGELAAGDTAEVEFRNGEFVLEVGSPEQPVLDAAG